MRSSLVVVVALAGCGAPFSGTTDVGGDAAADVLEETPAMPPNALEGGSDHWTSAGADSAADVVDELQVDASDPTADVVDEPAAADCCWIAWDPSGGCCPAAGDPACAYKCGVPPAGCVAGSTSCSAGGCSGTVKPCPL